MNWFINFLKDERGLETIEFITAAVPVTGGGALAFVAIREDVGSKSETLIEIIAVENP